MLWLIQTAVQLVRAQKPQTKGEAFTTSKLASGARTADSDYQKKNSDEIYFPFVWILCGWINLAIIAGISSVIGGPQLSTLGLLVSNASFIFMELFLLVFFLRRVKFESIGRLHALIDSKKSYVR